jgi:predicted RNase H-like HicB family nuclease
MTKISPELWEEAEKLAARGYEVEISKNTLSDGKEVFVAKNPELKGCTAQAHTLEESLRELDLARINYIYFKLVDGRPINPPSQES